MAIAYWCVLVAALLPYAWTAIAKTGASGYNNKDPRGWVAKQDSHRVRNANGAQLNAFEAFPAFAAGVLMAQLAGVEPGRIGVLAMVFVAFRVLHGVFYLAGTHWLRSLAWVGGFGCVVLLLVQAALRISAT